MRGDDLARHKSVFVLSAAPWLAKKREECVSIARFGSFGIESCSRVLARRFADCWTCWGACRYELHTVDDFFDCARRATAEVYERCVCDPRVECCQVAALGLLFECGKHGRPLFIEELDRFVARKYNVDAFISPLPEQMRCPTSSYLERR